MSSGCRRGAVVLAAAVCAPLLGLCAERLLGLLDPFPMHRLAGLPQSAVVLAADGEPLRITATAEGRVLPVRLAEVSPYLVQAVIAAEDERFVQHGGVDAAAVLRAALQNLGAGRIVSGASTLTMQVARMIEPHRKSVWGKAVEAFRARQLERRLCKAQILELYLNHVPLGPVRGFEAASRLWFGCGCGQLDAARAATLVALLPAPSARAPDRRPERLRQARDRVLARMGECGFLSAAEVRRAQQRPLQARRHAWPFAAPHACDFSLAAAGRDGGTLRTDLDPALQARVEREVAAFDGGGADGVAVVVLQRPGGELRAMVGGRDWQRSKVNAAISRRSAGSTLKPFLYSLAIERGVTGPAGVLADRPVAFGDWRPANFSRRHAGSLRADLALATSANLPAVGLLRTVGPAEFAGLLRRLGLRLPERGLHLDAALGTMAVSPLELARAYLRWCERPGELGLGRDSVGKVLRAMSLRPLVPGESAAGQLAWKSGTSSGRRDSWCAGIGEEYVVVVWLGNLDGRGLPDLVGAPTAGALLARVLPSSGSQ